MFSICWMVEANYLPNFISFQFMNIITDECYSSIHIALKKWVKVKQLFVFSYCGKIMKIDA